MIRFIVCPAATTLFRVEITNVRIQMARPDQGCDKCWFRGNFDNYRTIVSPKVDMFSNGEAFFDDYTGLFVYETVVDPPELLVVKLFTINVFGKTEMDFLGTASIDLLTLAAGPKKVVLRLMNGDSVVGRFIFQIEMSDQTDTLVWMKDLHVESVGQKHPLMSDIRVEWEPNGCPKQRTHFVDTEVDPLNHLRSVVYPDQPHSIPMTLNSLHAGAGLTFRVLRTKSCAFDDELGCATIMFVDGLKEVDEGNQLQTLERSSTVSRMEKSANPAAPQLNVDGGSMSVHAASDPSRRETPPAPGSATNISVPATSAEHTSSSKKVGDVHVNEGVVQEMVPLSIAAPEQRRFERSVEFKVETTGGQDNSGEQFSLSGKVWLSKIPRFAQMLGGLTVEGVVCGGTYVPGNHPKPPFCEVEDSSV